MYASVCIYVCMYIYCISGRIGQGHAKKSNECTLGVEHLSRFSIYHYGVL